MDRTNTRDISLSIALKIEEWEKYDIPSMIEGGLVPGIEVSRDMSPEEKLEVIYPLAKLKQLAREKYGNK